MPIGTICLDCGGITLSARSGRCPTCLPAYLERRPKRSGSVASPEAKAKRREHQGIVNSRRWRKVAAFVKERDGGCVSCGTTRSLSVHHTVPARLAPNPYDPEICVTLCRSCHGRTEAAERRRALEGGEVPSGGSGRPRRGTVIFPREGIAGEVPEGGSA